MMVEDTPDEVVAGLAEMFGARVLYNIKEIGRRKCTEAITSCKLGINEYQAREIIFHYEDEIMQEVGHDRPTKEKAVILARFYRGVLQAVDATAANLLVEHGCARAELLATEIDYNPEAYDD